VVQCQFYFASESCSLFYHHEFRKSRSAFQRIVLITLGGNDLMADRIHPNGEGYEIMAGRFYKEIKPYL